MNPKIILLARYVYGLLHFYSSNVDIIESKIKKNNIAKSGHNDQKTLIDKSPEKNDCSILRGHSESSNGVAKSFSPNVESSNSALSLAAYEKTPEISFQDGAKNQEININLASSLGSEAEQNNIYSNKKSDKIQQSNLFSSEISKKQDDDKHFPHKFIADKDVDNLSWQKNICDENRAAFIEAIEGAKTFPDIENALRKCQCDLKKTATNTVIYDGDPNADILFVGEAPGEQEDLKGIPFCGQSGEMLNNLIEFIGLQRKNTLITNTVFWRPESNRQPTMDEHLICLPVVEKIIAIVMPKVLVLLGATAARLLQTNDVIGAVRGKILNYNNHFMKNESSCKTIVSYHPSYLLRQPTKKRESMIDFLLIKQTLEMT